MARKRFRVPGYVASTRGHSSIKKWSYSPKYLDDTYVPEFVYPRHRIDTTGEENDIRRSVNKELMFSSHAVEDTYDMASKSRNRDQEILRSASQAIVDTETYHSPKAAVASRRARSQPPSSVTVTARTTLSNRSSVPPRATVVSAPSYTSKRGSHKERSSGVGKRYLDEEGKVTKPKNIMSWKYRLQSRVAPEDLLYQPKIYANVRDQLRDVHDKMDRHRQLMDRYLITDPSTEDVKSKIMSMYCDMEDRYPHRYRGRSGAATKSSAEVSHSTAGTSVRQKTPAPYSPSRVLLQSETQDNYRPISDVRRRVRRVICKNRKDPSYYK